jgi:two-component system, NarL family, nitrate/nitrite response regulator NarL
VTTAELHGAIVELLAGHMPIASSLTPHLVRMWRTGADDGGFALTARELEVLELLVRGHSYPAIALALAIELTTVQTHIRNLYRKLGVASKAEAATLAARHRLVG